MAAAVERIVVQATPQDKKAITAKAKKLDLPVSELMRRGAFAYESGESNDELGALADAAKRAADCVHKTVFLHYGNCFHKVLIQ